MIIKALPQEEKQGLPVSSCCSIEHPPQREISKGTGRDRTYPREHPRNRTRYTTELPNKTAQQNMSGTPQKLIGRGAPHGKGCTNTPDEVQPFAVQIGVRFYLDIRYKIPNFDSVTKSNKTDLWKGTREKTGKVEPEKVPEGRVRHVHQDHESAYSNGRRSTLPDRHVFELAEVRENGKVCKAHHSGTEKRAIRSIQEILSMRSRPESTQTGRRDKRQLSLF